ncbi:MAG: DUF2851 family protein [Bacteroidota bacterium]|nr:DUF2851 family protein [Bacteroidota bacterium]
MDIPETFLHYLWKYRLYNTQSLKTSAGKAIDIIHPGIHNFDAGPDFLNGKIKIDGQLWAGNIEIHKKTSDWKKHKHQEDKAYNNVILHIVAEDDHSKIIQDGREILTVKPEFDQSLFQNYNKYLSEDTMPMCSEDLHEVNAFTISSWLPTLLIERLERKTKDLKQLLTYTKNSWEEAFYIFMASAFGSGINSQAFEMTVKALPLTILVKHKNSLFQTEALLLGQSGLLTQREPLDDYSKKLKKEYLFLQKKYGLKPIDAHLWKYLRIRPANFPDIRLAQFARLIFDSTHLFSKLLEAKDSQTIEKFLDIKIADYWETHYKLGQESGKRKKSFGKTARRLVIINTIVPTLFLYGKEKDKDEFKNQALSVIESLPPENNKIIREWKAAGIDCRSAAESQALIQLSKAYCQKKRCLECRIGNALISNLRNNY